MSDIISRNVLTLSGTFATSLAFRNRFLAVVSNPGMARSNNLFYVLLFTGIHSFEHLFCFAFQTIHDRIYLLSFIPIEQACIVQKRILIHVNIGFSIIDSIIFDISKLIFILKFLIFILDFFCVVIFYLISITAVFLYIDAISSFPLVI